MMICPKCNKAMKHVMRFSPEKNCELYVCKSCYFETKPKRLKFDSIEIIQDKTEHAKTKLKKDNKVKQVKNKVKKKKGKKK